MSKAGADNAIREAMNRIYHHEEDQVYNCLRDALRELAEIQIIEVAVEAAKCPQAETNSDQDKYYPFGRSVSQQSHVKPEKPSGLRYIKCKNCGTIPVANKMVMENDEFFCDEKCWKEYREDCTKDPNSEANSGQDKYYPFGRSVPDEAKKPVHTHYTRSLIEGYLKADCKPEAIRSLLASEHEIQISPNQLGGHITQIKRQKAKEAEESKGKALAAIRTYEASRLPVEPLHSPKEAKSPVKPTIPSSEPEATIYRLHKKHTFPSEIRAYLFGQGYRFDLDEIEMIIRGFQA